MSLPIAEFRDDILELLYTNKVVIITAETGAGKSTQVPRYLMEAGFRVVVTQPRRIAARSLAARVAEETCTQLGDSIGYRTAVDGKWSAQTRCLYCTDGLELVRELMGSDRHHDVLILDEVHEWNLNMEVLLAWAKRRLKRGSPFKLVIMSATIDEEALSAYFGGAAVVRVPGRLFEIAEQDAGRSIESDARQLLEKGRNVLVFQPGKAEIEKTIGILQKSGVRAKLLPLHGDLTPEQQDECFKSYQLPKCVVSTNVAQTSITIPDVDAVVDSGLERRIELSHGVEGLYTRPISLADRQQRKGRSGRTRPGIYIDHYSLNEERGEYPKAEIQRVRLDQVVLRLAEAGVAAESLEFFHQPRRSDITFARRSLETLGCLTSDGEVTEIGHKVARLPVAAHVGRMIVEAERLGVVPSAIRIAAIMEAGPLGERQNPAWRELCGDEDESDCLAQLALYRAAGRMATDEEREANGVHVRTFNRTLDMVEHIQHALSRLIPTESETGGRVELSKAICAGMVDRIYTRRGQQYTNGEGFRRDISRDSVVSDAELVVAVPFDLDVRVNDEEEDEREDSALHLLTFVTSIKPEWLSEVAPHLVSVEATGEPRYDPRRDKVIADGLLYFRDRTFRSKVVVDDPEVATPLIAEWITKLLMSPPGRRERLSEEYGFAGMVAANRSRVQKSTTPKDVLLALVIRKLAGACSLKEVGDCGDLIFADDELSDG